MARLSSILTTCLLVALSRAGPLSKRVDGSTVQGTLGADSFWNDFDGGFNNYTMYTGNGSIAAGWPPEISWVSFNDMWTTNLHVMQRSCNLYYNATDNTDEEIQNLYDSIKQVAHDTRVDHRFILAAIMQETKGCVRAASSTSKDGINNPGLLQDFKGTHSCNNDGKVLDPCPKDQILGMVSDGVAGTDAGHGFAQDINSQASVPGIEKAEAYYRAARLYNSGAIDDSQDLGKGVATHCYASDIANRLVGWVDAPTLCTLDANNQQAVNR